MLSEAQKPDNFIGPNELVDMLPEDFPIFHKAGSDVTLRAHFKYNA